jgi:predicted Zn-dependent peptidase
MEVKEYTDINETLYKEVLDNGLSVYVLSKPDYNKVYGLATTNYGSIDNDFISMTTGKRTRVPDGIAHFLEHKLFEKEEGDLFQDFSKLSANSNAFTSFTKTSYLFSTTEEETVTENIHLLLRLISHPYFTDESVNKEKGIIGQEIQMYQDDPGWRLYFGMIENLYPNSSLAIDIAGTVPSIQEITKEYLYSCFETFYHPSNMTVFIVGNVDANDTIETIKKYYKDSKKTEAKEITRFFDTSAPVVPEREFSMDVVMPKFIFGMKGVDEIPQDGHDLLKYKLSMTLFLQMLFGTTSQNYLQLYNGEIVDDSFEYEFILDRGFHFMVVLSDSNHPEVAFNRVKELLLTSETSDEVTAERLELLKKRMLGKYFSSLNSLEYIANQFSGSLYGEVTLFDLPSVLSEISIDDVKTAAKSFINEDEISRLIIREAE